MNTRPEEEEPSANEVHPAVALVGELHEYLLSALVEKLGDDVQVAEAADPGNGLVAYRFEIHGAQCRAAIVPYTALGAVLSLNARLGRVQSGYGRALRWLGQNRSCNTLALAYDEDAARAGDLLVSANRNVLSGDAAGVRYELEDFCLEVRKAITGLKLWFPHLIDGVELRQLEQDGEDDEKLRGALADPRTALRDLEKSEESMNDHCIFYCCVTRWLALWERNLQMLNSQRMRELAADDPGLRAKVVAARLRATLVLGRYREALEVLPQVDDSQVPPSRKAALEAECLCELDQPEEALDVLQSAELDEEPWVHLIRSCACMKLGRQEEAAQHFTDYEELVGHDSLARKRIAALAGDDDETG